MIVVSFQNENVCWTIKVTDFPKICLRKSFAQMPKTSKIKFNSFVCLQTNLICINEIQQLTILALIVIYQAANQVEKKRYEIDTKRRVYDIMENIFFFFFIVVDVKRTYRVIGKTCFGLKILIAVVDGMHFEIISKNRTGYFFVRIFTNVIAHHCNEISPELSIVKFKQMYNGL